MTEEQNLDRIVVKISLINEDTNLSMYDKYGYFLNTTRADNLIPNDLISSLKQRELDLGYSTV